MVKWLLTTRHNDPLEIPVTPSAADFGVNAALRKANKEDAADIETKRINVIQDSVEDSRVFANKSQLPSRVRSRSSSVDRGRMKNPLVTPTPSTVRADINAT